MQTLPPKLQILKTDDGSPTLSLTEEQSGAVERMHHSGGALSESLYIYHQALQVARQFNDPPRVASLGLGLGYNEWIVIASCAQFKLWSFEQDDFVRLGFESWLEEESPDHALHAVFTQALTLVAEHFQILPQELKRRGARSRLEGNWQIRQRYPEAAADLHEVTCFFYDAFSKSWDSALWQEQSLRTHLDALMAPSSVFASYAATGALHRALKSLGFCLTPKRGFAGKRESTLAIRQTIG